MELFRTQTWHPEGRSWWAKARLTSTNGGVRCKLKSRSGEKKREMATPISRASVSQYYHLLLHFHSSKVVGTCGSIDPRRRSWRREGTMVCCTPTPAPTPTNPISPAPPVVVGYLPKWPKSLSAAYFSISFRALFLLSCMIASSGSPSCFVSDRSCPCVLELTLSHTPRR